MAVVLDAGGLIVNDADVVITSDEPDIAAPLETRGVRARIEHV